jgi:hypothetical protein
MVSSTVLSRRILTNIGMRMPDMQNIINIRSNMKDNRKERMPVRTLGNGADDVEDEGAVLVAQQVAAKVPGMRHTLRTPQILPGAHTMGVVR